MDAKIIRERERRSLRYQLVAYVILGRYMVLAGISVSWDVENFYGGIILRDRAVVLQLKLTG